MLRIELYNLLEREPFEPFRIKMVNGDQHDVFDPQSMALLELTVLLATQDGNWVIFPLDKINSIESLLADYHGQLPTAM